MHDAELEKVETWYSEMKEKSDSVESVFNLHCSNDARILRLASQCLIDLFLVDCDVHHFVEVPTLASACNLVFRRTFLKANTVGLMPALGYAARYVESKIEVQMLSFLDSSEYDGELEYAGKSGGQKKIRVYYDGVKFFKCDGYHDSSKEVIFINGCFFPCSPKF